MPKWSKVSKLTARSAKEEDRPAKVPTCPHELTSGAPLHVFNNVEAYVSL
jgi:hypothetical protein